MNFHYAGFGKRLIALLIDSLILTGIGFICYLFLSSFLNGITFHLIARLLGIIIGWSYFAFLESSSLQATIGKKLLGLIVTDEYNKSLNWEQATGRHFSKILSGMIIGIGYLMPLWNERNQALHDKIAGTLVLEKLV